MSDKPLVSCITIFFNCVKYLEEAIESVFAQTYDNWELLLVDDGSTDGSTAIALRFAKQHPDRVRYLEHGGHQNRGACASRNLGTREAKAEYIAFLDSDDVWLPDKLLEQVAILNAHPEAAMVYGPSLRWYSWTGNPEDKQRDNLRKYGCPPDSLVKPPTMVVQYFRGTTATPSPSNLLLRRDLLRAVGGFEESFTGIYQAYEDQAFLAKVHLSHTVFVAGRCWDKYRKHPESCVSVVNAAGKANVVRLYFFNWLQKYLSKNGFRNTEVWQLLHKEVLPLRHPTLYRLSRRVSSVVGRAKRVLKRILRVSTT